MIFFNNLFNSKNPIFLIFFLFLIFSLFPYLILFFKRIKGKHFFIFGVPFKDFIKSWIAFCTVLVAFIGIIIQLYMQISLQNKQLSLQEVQIESQIKLQRFSSGVELLGNANESARIGGVFNLFFLSYDFFDYREPVCEILCSHIRTITSDKDYQEKYKENPSTEVQTILDLLFPKYNSKDNRYLSYHIYPINDTLFNIPNDTLFYDPSIHDIFYFCEKNLKKSFLYGVDFSFTVLNKVFFGRSKLNESHFHFSYLIETFFNGVELSNSIFTDSKLYNVYFQNSTLNYVYFSSSSIYFYLNTNRESNSFGSSLHDVFFDSSTLSNVYFGCKDCDPSKLERVDFSNSIFEGEIDFTGTILDNIPNEEITCKGCSLKLTTVQD